MVESSCELLDLMGLPYYRHDAGDFEAEAICAAMTRSGITSASLSEDMDTALFSDGLFISKIFKAHSPKEDALLIDIVQVREEMGLSKEEFLDVCILLGTDFSGTLKGVGPVGAGLRLLLTV
jgi:5'-3' exonuclease